MKNIPPKIYLQVDADGETPKDFNELEVSWTSERVYPTDIEYILADDVLRSASAQTKAEVFNVMFDTTSNPES